MTLTVALIADVPAASAEHDAAPPLAEPPAATAQVYDMIFPITGTVNYTDSFGACRSGCSRRHQGIDMMAAKMTPIVAVADGTVGWMDNEQGGDCCAMAIKHDDGWESWYIHMNNDTPGTDDGQGYGFVDGIVPGARVTAGQLIGWVGDSGNAENSGSHLHFELHDTNGTPINPYDSLNAAPRLSAPVASVDARGCDFDGDGYDDLVVGAPNEDLGFGGARVDAGAVTVLYGSPSGVDGAGAQLWHYNSPGVTSGLFSGARFGAATACGDFDGDSYDDLAIGAPGRPVFGRADVGAVTLLEGSPAGLQAVGTNLWHFASPNVIGSVTEGSGFGSAMASGDFNNDGYDDVAIGAPGKLRKGKAGAGVVVILLGSASGIDGTSRMVAENTSGVPGAVEADDAFGSALAVGDFDGDGEDDLAVGIPNERIPASPATGEAVVIPGGTNVFDLGRTRRLYAPSAGWVDVAGSAFGSAITAGDVNGDGRDDLIISAPGDSSGGIGSGSIRVFNGAASNMVKTASSVELALWTSGIPGTAADGDRFGAAVAADDFNADGFVDIAVGVPFADVNGASAAGAVITINGSRTGADASSGAMLHQGNLQVFVSPEVDDWFGRYLGVGDFAGDEVASLVIGVPGQSIGGIADAGVVHVVYGQVGGLSMTGVDMWRENMAIVPGRAETDDGWGIPAGAG